MDNIKTEDIYKLLLAHWKKLAIVGLIAIVISSFISSPWVIRPKYKSIAVAFPTNLTPFSEESTTEQLLQFFNSDEIKDNLAKKFNLYDYYEIDTLDSRAKSFYNYKYQENFKVSNTLYESVEIEVIDHSPAKAQQLAQGMLDEVDVLIEKSKKEKVAEYVKNYSNLLLIKKNEIDSLEANLKKIRVNDGIIDVNAQVKALTKKQGKGKGLSDEEKKLWENLKLKSGEYTIYQNQLFREMDIYSSMKKDYDRNLLDLNSKTSYMTIVSYPSFPDKKCYPVRWAIVLSITLSSLLLASLFIILSNKKRQ